MAYFGDPVLAADLLFRPDHSVIDQSLNSRLGATTTNGDGFGLGWYGDGPEPAVYKSTQPAWSDPNLRELAYQVRTPLLFAHVRASTGTAVQRSNCHPFRHGRWMFMHNGLIRDFRTLKRDLVMAVEPELYPHIEGTTDSEVLFFLALTFGLDDDPFDAMARAVGLVEDVARAHGVENAVQMTAATSNGSCVWGFRYSTEGASRSLYYSHDVGQLRKLHPDVAVLKGLGEETRLIVSEPLLNLPGAWVGVPEASAGVVRPGTDEIRSFVPVPPG
ncbi:class II glutamine amidotransferase [Intrasporangium sp. DVR]|uniref:class II glutamine amidotransferase n=1 Tax=Intrasporangium sp. DVR TaxID=3127867 RepID=UPI00313A756A